MTGSGMASSRHCDDPPPPAAIGAARPLLAIHVKLQLPAGRPLRQPFFTTDSKPLASALSPFTTGEPSSLPHVAAKAQHPKSFLHLLSGVKRTDSMTTRAARGRGGRGRGNIPVTPNPVDPNPVDPNPVASNPIAPNPVVQPAAPQEFVLGRDAKTYKHLGGKTFSGTGTVIEAIAWLKTANKILSGMRLATHDRAFMGAWLLHEEAELWWDSITADDEEGTVRTWDEFSALFKAKYVPEQALDRMHEEFANLQQGDRSIQDYLNKFTQLSRYAPELILTNKKKNTRFIHGLQHKYHDRAMSNINLPFSELVEMVCNYEDYDEWDARQDSAKGNKRKAAATQPGPSNTATATQPASKVPKGSCYNCGKAGHWSNVCTAPRRQKPDQSTSAQNPRSPPECFNCHKMGHIRRNCPLLKNAQVAHIYEGANPPASTPESA